MKVLLIEDDPQYRVRLEERIKNLGVDELIIPDTYKEVIKILETQKNFDYIVTDFNLYGYPDVSEDGSIDGSHIFDTFKNLHSNAQWMGLSNSRENFKKAAPDLHILNKMQFLMTDALDRYLRRNCTKRD